MTVEVCGETIRFETIPPGISVSARFGTPDDESNFKVRGQLEDGAEIDDSCGYVVWEDYGKRFNIVIRPGGEARYKSGLVSP